MWAFVPLLGYNSAALAKFRGCPQRTGEPSALREGSVRVPGAGFEPARSCEQRFLRPPAYAIRLPGRAPQILRARPGVPEGDYLVVFFNWLLNVL